jgi:hypothetical protein
LYEGQASKAFRAISLSIKSTLDRIHSRHRSIFANPKNLPSKDFVNDFVGIEVPDYHSACIVAATTGTPIHKIKPGPRILGGQRVQLNAGPLQKYGEALEKFVDRL